MHATPGRASTLACPSPHPPTGTALRQAMEGVEAPASTGLVGAAIEPRLVLYDKAISALTEARSHVRNAIKALPGAHPMHGCVHACGGCPCAADRCREERARARRGHVRRVLPPSALEMHTFQAGRPAGALTGRHNAGGPVHAAGPCWMLRLTAMRPLQPCSRPSPKASHAAPMPPPCLACPAPAPVPPTPVPDTHPPPHTHAQPRSSQPPTRRLTLPS